LELIREAVETFIRLWKSEVSPNAVLVSSDDIFEVTKPPSLVLQGPTVSENAARRTPAKMFTTHPEDLAYDERRHPRLYHLDFDVIATTGTEVELLTLMGKVARFYQVHTVMHIGDHGSLNLTELMPLGGLKRVNLSNLRQASGRCRIEDCPVYDGRVIYGQLIKEVLLRINAQGE